MTITNMPVQSVLYEFEAFNAGILLIPDERISTFTIMTGALKIVR